MEVITKVFAFVANVLREGEKRPWITLEMFVKGSCVYLKINKLGRPIDVTKCTSCTWIKKFLSCKYRNIHKMYCEIARHHCLISHAQAKVFFFFPSWFLCSITWNRLWIPLWHLQIYFVFLILEFHFLPTIWTAQVIREKVSSIPWFQGFCLSILMLTNVSFGILVVFLKWILKV